MPSFWGSDIGGHDNTFVARLLPGNQFTTAKVAGSATDLAAYVWAQSGSDDSPIILALDAVLSHDIDSDKGWRPADSFLKSLLDPHLVTTPGASVVVSPSAFMGHRHLELSATFGAYFVVVETHPTACIALMGAPLAALRRYKKDKTALSRVFNWLLKNWLPGSGPISAGCRHGDLDSLVCALVAKAVGGSVPPGLELFTPVLAKEAEPRPSLAGASPFYLLRKPRVCQAFEHDARDKERESTDDDG